MTGYESVGTVISRGSEVQSISPGDRVVCFYGHRSHAAVPESAAIPVPEGFSDETALLCILTCDAAKGVRRLALGPEEPVLITGAGAIGLLTTFVCKNYGIRTVDVVEPREERRELARRLGARAAYSPRRLPDRRAAYPAALECSSSAAAFSQLQRSMTPGGRICLLSDGNIEPLSLSTDFHEKELRVLGSSDGWDYREHALWYFDILREESSRADELKEIFDLHTTFEELPAVFEKMAGGKLSPVKVLVRH